MAMARSQTVRRLLEEARAKRAQGEGARGYPQVVRDAVVAYATGARSAGVTWADLATELGVSTVTLQKWCTEKAAFRAITVAQDRSDMSGGSFVVHGPQGLRIDNVDIETLAELWRRLS
jgi:DNA invertase Pin-like site-specific DNA recombinase